MSIEHLSRDGSIGWNIQECNLRQVIAGDGSDSTAATQAYLESTDRPILRDLIVIGDPEDPQSIWLTNHEAPVLYRPYGTFKPAVVSRDGVEAKIGLEAQSLSIDWSPGAAAASSATVNTGTASPYQLAAQHFYDNWPVLILRCFMPTPGDAETLGCATWFGGRIQNCKVGRNKLTFNTKSNLDVVTEKVPSTVVEVTNTLAGNTAVTLPAGDPSIPTFECFTGSSETNIIADCLSPTADKIYAGSLFVGGYLVFLSGTGATLAGAWSAISGNGIFTDGDGNRHSYFTVYSPLPWPPTPGVDTFYVSKAPPIDIADESYFGFPYVPAPQQAV
jgi:hypothetical protein